eukprot:TRINITY_DN33678_c0_g1_i1.p1 TRINITY_DN33678_c0_g1~~TRINITY_DN33678_c0_g1_i1.p1  ORF type:complete len:139 (-),score=16.83 TRINITY_DN33678_c0_g1_i1:101-517(-)
MLKGEVQAESHEGLTIYCAKEDSYKEDCQGSNFLSIVDRIKNDITTLKTLSKTNNQTSSNISKIDLETEHAQDQILTNSHNKLETKPKVESRSPIENNDQQRPSDHKQTGIKVALDRSLQKKNLLVEIFKFQRSFLPI